MITIFEDVFETLGFLGVFALSIGVFFLALTIIFITIYFFNAYRVEMRVAFGNWFSRVASLFSDKNEFDPTWMDEEKFIKSEI